MGNPNEYNSIYHCECGEPYESVKFPEDEETYFLCSICDFDSEDNKPPLPNFPEHTACGQCP